MKKKTITNLIIHIILAILVVIWVLPIIWIVLISFREEQGAYTTTFLPTAYTIDNYVRLFKERDVFNFPLWFANTFIVSCFSCVIATFYTLAVSYSMSRMRFKMRKPFMNIALILGMFPGFMSMIAVYYIFIDGCTRWQIFTKITIPLSKPIIVQTVLSAFMAPWVDFIFAKVITGGEPKYYTVAIGLWNMLTKENITQYYTRFAAGAVIVSIPIAILFMKMQSCYMESNAGAVKG